MDNHEGNIFKGLVVGVCIIVFLAVFVGIIYYLMG